ncbi:hypothetical protein M407DRAFT_245121 [Tulasnella calospora MUT 4182]|uniref:Aldehyde dehydrogenase domain-containing protein n=1 Tax=Tulasnella calospora MUT 4182 TaxID=1051891 RepID=A0A0C3QCX9_9AGAM|nr:hypothetical protein M407DRAFT_245121 [Tulasnella calospora MUT 4182]
MAQVTISPHTLESYITRNYPSVEELEVIAERAHTTQTLWAEVPLDDRIAIAEKFVEEFQKLGDEVASTLTAQMGRPIKQSPGEVRGTVERAKYMISIAKSSLADVELKDTDKPGFRRFIKRVPLGVVLVIAPWNYPYLTSINSVLPAILAGNSVVLKPSPQTPLTGELLRKAFIAAGLPEDLLQVVHLSPELAEALIKNPLIKFVSFTGSVATGHLVAKEATLSGAFKGVALELGGKDAAYVREDADLDYTTAELVDGAFFNSGQSCCAIERIYVHQSKYDDFVNKFVEIAKTYKLGDPTKEEVNLGPVVTVGSADKIRKQVQDAVMAGAKTLLPDQLFPAAKEGTAFVAPQVLVDVDHNMDVMTEETFGPIVGIMKVSDDKEALHLMNDSKYGLTASIWTDAAGDPKSEDAFLKLCDGLDVGTVFLNRCDYLDPALAWTGSKDSGRGVSLSKFGYDQLTRPKSVHMKIKTS